MSLFPSARERKHRKKTNDSDEEGEGGCLSRRGASVPFSGHPLLGRSSLPTLFKSKMEEKAIPNQLKVARKKRKKERRRASNRTTGVCLLFASAACGFLLFCTHFDFRFPTHEFASCTCVVCVLRGSLTPFLTPPQTNTPLSLPPCVFFLTHSLPSRPISDLHVLHARPLAARRRRRPCRRPRPHAALVLRLLCPRPRPRLRPRHIPRRRPAPRPATTTATTARSRPVGIEKKWDYYPTNGRCSAWT